MLLRRSQQETPYSGSNTVVLTHLISYANALQCYVTRKLLILLNSPVTSLFCTTIYQSVTHAKGT